ncbi:MAG: LPS assembly lipoprotein LptE [Woeseiaceae bacterium]|jgi:LPS-assembly lipoprotein|nr:LPS assembly lipoprotein LptE [Woeseiaceae bacterium]
MLIRLVPLLLALALLGGCGFQLQGAVTVPEAMERTYIDTVDPYSLFYTELSRRLAAAGIDVVDSPDAATAVLSLLSDETGQRVLSVSARNTPTEFEVFYTIEYALVSDGGASLPQQTLTLTRDYIYDETVVLGKAREEDLLRRAIVEDMVRIVLKQISTL